MKHPSHEADSACTADGSVRAPIRSATADHFTLRPSPNTRTCRLSWRHWAPRRLLLKRTQLCERTTPIYNKKGLFHYNWSRPTSDEGGARASTTVWARGNLLTTPNISRGASAAGERASDSQMSAVTATVMITSDAYEYAHRRIPKPCCAAGVLKRARRS